MKYNPEQIYDRFIDKNKALQNNKYYLVFQQNEYRLKNLEVKFSELLEFMIEQSKTPVDNLQKIIDDLEKQPEPKETYTPCNHSYTGSVSGNEYPICVHCGEPKPKLCVHQWEKLRSITGENPFYKCAVCSEIKPMCSNCGHIFL